MSSFPSICVYNHYAALLTFLFVFSFKKNHRAYPVLQSAVKKAKGIVFNFGRKSRLRENTVSFRNKDAAAKRRGESCPVPVVGGLQ